MMNVELIIAQDTKEKNLFIPATEEGIEWITERRGVPGKLTFRVVADGILNFSEGSPVRLKVDGNEVFYGFVFVKNRDRDNIISVTAYDQLRYLKNKDTYVYENKTASEFIQMVAADFNLQLGEITDTKFKIKSRVEDNTTLFDMIENALDLTLTNQKEMYVLYDEFGKLTLKNISEMYVGNDEIGYLCIDPETAGNFNYSSSIENTYNKVKLAYDNEKTGKRDVYIAQDSNNINLWGVLQFYDKLQDGENGKAKADALLELYNKKTKNLRIIDAFGDWRVRAGSLVLVRLNLGDVVISNFMMVEKCKHKLKLDEHLMDITLRGGDFVG